jgi:endonuclease III
MQDESVLLKNIEMLGDEYIREHISGLNRERLEQNWWEALKFFFSRSFMRGRNDELSNRYYNFTIAVLMDYFDIDEKEIESAYARLTGQRSLFKDAKTLKKKSLKNYPEFKDIAASNSIIKALTAERKKIKDALPLGNVGDIVMVLEVLNFITENDQHKNIYNYLLRKIEKMSSIGEAYQELNDIKYVGDKIASFVIRDILLLNPQISIKDSEYEFAFPVDTWVNQIADRLGCKKKTIEETKKCLIAKSIENGINTFKFAAGLWYLGFNSLQVLLDNFLGQFEF